MARFQTKPISGARDFLPLDVLRRQYVIGVIERVYQSYGFEPLDTPVMERLDTLLGKYGEEGDQLIFRVAKRGAKLQRALAESPTEDDIADAGLRYDLTVPLARIVAEYSNQLPRYFKRYHIAPVYRADRPAKGRFREFYQCDLDVVGSSSQLVEAEVLNAGAQVLQELGFRGRDASGFRLRLNHRGVLRGLMEVTGVPTELESDALVAVDKLDKIGLDGVEKELHARGLDQTASTALLELMAAAPDDTAAVLGWLHDRLAGSANGTQALAELEEVVTLTESGPAGAHICIDPYLARGLSYYTGPIYEIEFPSLSGSGGAGGRYDDLGRQFRYAEERNIPVALSWRPVPSPADRAGVGGAACGFSLGLERILLIMEERGLFPKELAGQPQVLITRLSYKTEKSTRMPFKAWPIVAMAHV